MPGIYFMTLKNLSIIVKRSNIWSGICIFKYFHVSQAQYYLVLFILTTNWSISIIWPGFKIRWTAEFARQKFFKRLIFIFYLILAKTKYKSTLRYKYISGKISGETEKLVSFVTAAVHMSYYVYQFSLEAWNIYIRFYIISNIS